MSKNLKNRWKLIKIANIDREILHIFWTTWGVSGKMCLMILLKVTKNQGFTLLLVIQLVVQLNLELKYFIKGYGFLSFTKKMSKNIDSNIIKNLSAKFSKKLLGHTKQSATDILKTASKTAMEKNSRSSWWFDW